MQERKLIALIASILQVPEEDVTPQADLVEDLGADSLALARIASAAEDAFEVRLRAEQLQYLLTVGDLLEILRKETASRPSDGLEPDVPGGSSADS